jgi:hypothetical protein
MDEFRWLQGQHESESEQSQLHVHQYPSRLSSGWALHLEGALNSPLYGGGPGAAMGCKMSQC